jgi:hypothetical protein
MKLVDARFGNGDARSLRVIGLIVKSDGQMHQQRRRQSVGSGQLADYRESYEGNRES